MAICALTLLLANATDVRAGVQRAASPGLATRDALAAMLKEATDQHIHGVALIANANSEKLDSWTSDMVVVGDLAPKGANLLAIAYAKAAEAARTLEDSGTTTMPKLTGEFGWKGGVLLQKDHRIFIAAFSGGSETQDAAIAKIGLDILSR